jgi:glutamine synthetase
MVLKNNSTNGKVSFEYIWLDLNNNFRSKVRIMDNVPETFININIKHQEWNFDGSSTGQASGKDSEIFIKPYKMVQDINNESDYYVFCDCYYPNGDPHQTNTRKQAVDFFNHPYIKEMDTMFGIEQEFFVFNNGKPLVWNDEDTEPQGNYYCGNGSKNIKGRDYLDEVVRNLNFWNINVTGYNFEVAPGQMEIQICEKGIDGADNLIATRFILVRIAESYGWDIDFKPKPVFLNTHKWNGSGCHVNFSTNIMREHNFIDQNIIGTASEEYKKWNFVTESITPSVYQTACILYNMKQNHTSDISKFGSENNKLRLGGSNEASSYDTFNYGIANRGCSVRIPHAFMTSMKGYIEDRRPGADMDPYIVTTLITSYVKFENTETIQSIVDDLLNYKNK